MTDMLPGFMPDELFPIPLPRRVVVPVVRFSCPRGCSGTFANFPAFLGHVTAAHGDRRGA